MTHDHTPEPLESVPTAARPDASGWPFQHGQLVANGRGVLSYSYTEQHGEEGRANVARIVACWNACQGIPDPETTIPELISALREIDAWEPSAAPSEPGGMSIMDAIDKARQALARIEKGAPQG